MKYFVVLGLLVAATSAAFAQNPQSQPQIQTSKEYTVCSNAAKTQAEMNACASAEAARADKELNRVYGQVLSKAGASSEAGAKVKAAERAWLTYRDAYLDATFPAKDKATEYGSMYPLDAALLRAKLTQQQIIALQDLLKKYGG
jgi:uncharacterized protein YecT (DUF1311 family)